MSSFSCAARNTASGSDGVAGLPLLTEGRPAAPEPVCVAGGLRWLPPGVGCGPRKKAGLTKAPAGKDPPGLAAAVAESGVTGWEGSRKGKSPCVVGGNQPYGVAGYDGAKGLGAPDGSGGGGGGGACG